MDSLLALTTAIGYTSWPINEIRKTIYGYDVAGLYPADYELHYDYSRITVRAGAKYYFSKMTFRPYVQAEAGMNLYQGQRWVAVTDRRGKWTYEYPFVNREYILSPAVGPAIRAGHVMLDFACGVELFEHQGQRAIVIRAGGFLPLD